MHRNFDVKRGKRVSKYSLGILKSLTPQAGLRDLSVQQNIRTSLVFFLSECLADTVSTGYDCPVLSLISNFKITLVFYWGTWMRGDHEKKNGLAKEKIQTPSNILN